MARYTNSILGLLCLATYTSCFTLTIAPCETEEIKIVPENVPEAMPVNTPIVKNVPEPISSLSLDSDDFVIDQTNELIKEIVLPTLPEIEPVKSEEPEVIVIDEPVSTPIVERGDVVEEKPIVIKPVIAEKVEVVEPKVVEPFVIPEAPVLPEFVIPEFPFAVIDDKAILIEKIEGIPDTNLINEVIVEPPVPELTLLVVPEAPHTVIDEKPVESILEDKISKLTPLYVIPSISKRIPEPINYDKEIFFDNVLDRVFDPLVIPPAPELPPFIIPEIPQVVLEKEVIPNESITLVNDDKPKPCAHEPSHYTIPQYFSLPYYPVQKPPCEPLFYLTRNYALNVPYPWEIRNSNDS